MANYLNPLHRLLFFLILLIYTESLEPPFKLVCYYTNWGIYRPGLAKYTPENINPYLCTHLIYAFGGLSTRFEIKPFDAYNDIQQGNFKKFVDLKRHNSDLKTMIAIGGWNEGSKKFSKMVAESENRKKFIRSVMKFLRQHKFDGLDLDWEYPTFRDGGNPEDKEGYASLVQELRESFDDEQLGKGKKKLLLTMAVPAGSQYIDQGYDIPTLARDLDFFNLLTYDYYTAEEPTVRHHSPLYEVGDFEDWDIKKQYNVDFTVNYYIEKGVPANKLVLGIPTYGRAFTLDSDDTEYDAVAKGAAEAGPATREAGYLAYHEICQNIQEKDWEVKKPFPLDMGPYAFKGDQWVGYDDVDIVTEKAKYVVEHKLGGAMFWSLDTDDFRGHCGGEKSPLITAARKVLFSAKAAESAATSKPTKAPTKRTTTKRPTTTTTTTTEPPPEPVIEELAEEDQQLSDIPEEEQIVEDVVEEVVESKTKQEARERQDLESASSCQFGTKSGGRRRGKSTKTECAPPPAEEEEEEVFGAAASEDRHFTTPEPPTTPDPGVQFVCKDEGFFINPSDCRKYFWCLDSGPADLGVIPHHFTCPSGLFFNKRSDSCDYPTNVDCKMKPEPSAEAADKPARGRSATTARSSKRKSTTTTTAEPEVVEEEVVIEEEEQQQQKPAASGKTKSGTNIAQLLTLIEKLGGVEEVQKHLGIDGATAASTSSSNRRPAARSKSVQSPDTIDVPEEEVATARRAKASRTTEPAEEEATTAAPRRRPSRRRTTTTEAPPTTTKQTRRQPSNRRKPSTTEADIEEEPTTSRAVAASRRRQTTTTETSRPSSSRRRTTSTIPPEEDALVDNSRQSTTVQKFQQVDKTVDESGIVDKASRDRTNPKSGTDRLTTISGDESEDGVTDLETHTFGATRIPGLFNYVLVQRNGSNDNEGGNEGSSSSDGVKSILDLKSILDAHEAKSSSRPQVDELTAVPSTVTTKVDRQGVPHHQPEDTGESSTNIQVTSPHKVEQHQKLESSAAPPLFENIGVSLVDGDLPTSENKQQEFLQAHEEVSLTPPPPSDALDPSLPSDGPEYYDDYPEVVATDPGQPDAPTQSHTTTTTEQATTQTEFPETTITEVETTTPRRRPLVRIGGTRSPVPATSSQTSSTTTARPTTSSPAPPRVSLPRRPPTVRVPSRPAVQEPEIVDEPPTSNRGPASSLLNEQEVRHVEVDSSNPALSPVRVKHVRRPASSGQQQGDSAFEGLTVNESGEIECLEQGVYPHPIKCDRFVSCISENGVTKHYTYLCPPGQMYDDFTGRCLNEDQVECGPAK